MKLPPKQGNKIDEEYTISNTGAMIAMIDIDLSQYMTVEEAANELGLAQRSIRTMASAGLISTRKSPYGGTMVSRSSVEEYEKSRKPRGRPPKQQSE
jgi:hypothetical protein